MSQNSMESLIGINHCPICGRELNERATRVDGGHECACGEFIPEGLGLNSRAGCTHGIECNCARSMRR